MEGPGEINHIWITVDNKTTDADCFVLRDLVIRMYWDDEEDPSVESPLETSSAVDLAENAS